MNKHITKILSIILASVMLLGVFACAAPKENETEKNGETGKTAEGDNDVVLTDESTPGRARLLSAAYTPREVSGAGADAEFVKSQADFALALLKNSLSSEKSTLVSPLSVMLALAMCANGADTETLAEMERVLGMPIDRLNEYLRTYINNLPSDEKYKVLIANSIWFRASEAEFDPAADCVPFFEPDPDFLQRNADYYGAEIYASPFDESTLTAINEWVSKNTDGMIEQILDRISPEAVMYLVNTLMFDAEWASIYYDVDVHDGAFRAKNGAERNVSMMYSTEHTFLDGGNAVGFIKPYSGYKYGFAVLLPDEGIDVNDYVSSLTGEKLMSILNSAEGGTVYAQMPKFSFDYDITLNKALSAMGMPTAFDAVSADFTRLGHCADDSNIYIGRVIHKTHIEVGEKGTRAGAATLVEFMCGASMPENEHEVYLDRPFVFMIVDMETNLPLFIGTVMDIA